MTASPHPDPHERLAAAIAAVAAVLAMFRGDDAVKYVDPVDGNAAA